MSGHGFSPSPRHGCLFTANARERLSLNIHATGWLDWLQDSGYFREFVLWMDCCMDRMSFLGPRDPPLPPVKSSEPPLANFIAFAAQRNRRTVEVPIAEDGGKTHGIFTWTLLEGLRGAAADGNGRVTGRSLADWVRNAQVARLDPRDLDDVDVSKEPDVIQEDAALVFARGLSKPSFRVCISFPPGLPASRARLWSGAPSSILKEFTIGGAPEVVDIQPGLYLVDVPHAGLRQGFEVVSPMEVAVVEKGPPVAAVPGNSVFQLDIDPREATAEIFVIDSHFSLVDSNPAHLSTPLPFGLFKIKTRIGRSTTQRVILLDRDRPLINPAVLVQPAATVVPISGTAATHEYHEAWKIEAVNAVKALQAAGGRAAIMVMVRSFGGRGALLASAPPWEGVSIVDSQGKSVVNLEKDGKHYSALDPCATCTKAVDPGSYFLRQRLDDGTTIEQSLIVCEGWVHEVYVLRKVGQGETVVRPRPQVSVMMHKLGTGSVPHFEDRLIEIARVALADERKILNRELEALLMEKFDNPMAGIFGGHLVLVERDRDHSRDLRILNTVVRNLRSLVGAGHPDVTALALQCTEAGMREIGSLVGPPMLRRSWNLLAKAAQERPALIPEQMWERVQAYSTLPPFLVWAVDEAVKSAARIELAHAVLQDRTTEQTVATTAAVARDVTSAARARAASPREIRTVTQAVSRARASGLSRAAIARAAKLNVPPSAFEQLKKQIK